MENQAAVSFRHITKAFGSKVVANKDVSMDILRGEILALLGENGSGKTTLMNMLSGIYHQDAGQILVDGEEVHINSPKDAYALGIGMIHQHFKLVDWTKSRRAAQRRSRRRSPIFANVTALT